MTSPDQPSRRRAGLNRRRFLQLAGRSLLALIGPARLLGAASLASAELTGLRWSDPSTWGGHVPGRGDVALITKKVILDVNARVAGVRIKRGGELVFHPRRTVTLKSSGNVVVRGRLAMRPDTHAQVHRLVFVGVKESQFKGGGVVVLSSDVGLWVMDSGVLDIAGSDKLAWTRTAGNVSAGASTLELAEDPLGWSVGDQLAITPTLPPTAPRHYDAYDYASVTAVSGRTVTLSRATAFEHPAVNVGRGKTMTSEVLNLTRNVAIQGSAGHRTHVFIHSDRRQIVKNALIRYVGPRKIAKEGYTKGVLGRYGLHFHHCHGGSRGSVVSGVVIRDCGSHAFVPHMSHGVSFLDCISHNTWDEPYWYDPRPNKDAIAPPTNDLLLQGCVASQVKVDPPFRGFRMGGFFIGAGSGNIARNCVSVGVQGNRDASGFVWPEDSHGVWTFEDCAAHNNKVHGIFTWQNTEELHVVSRFVAYHNGGSGISHGAYLNPYKYEDSILYGNGGPALSIHALSADLPLEFVNLLCDGAGLSAYAIEVVKHRLPGKRQTTIRGCQLRAYQQAGIAWTWEGSDSQPDVFDVLDCTFDGNEFWLASGIHPASLIYVEDSVRGRITLERSDQVGVLHPEWNASVNPVLLP